VDRITKSTKNPGQKNPGRTLTYQIKGATGIF
jgi:hypothetical protein